VATGRYFEDEDDDEYENDSWRSAPDCIREPCPARLRSSSPSWTEVLPSFSPFGTKSSPHSPTHQRTRNMSNSVEQTFDEFLTATDLRSWDRNYMKWYGSIVIKPDGLPDPFFIYSRCVSDRCSRKAVRDLSCFGVEPRTAESMCHQECALCRAIS
jgi:hypothetical protein